jgi:predicted kinase
MKEVPPLIISPDNYLYTQEGKYEWAAQKVGWAWGQALHDLDVALKDDNYVFVVLMCGTSGSGKSTWLQKYAKPNVIYFDAMFAKAKDRYQIIARAQRAYRQIAAVVMTTPLDVCIARNKERSLDRQVPEIVVVKAFNELIHDLPKKNEGFDRIKMVPYKEPKKNPDSCSYGNIRPEDIDAAVDYYNDTYELPKIQAENLILEKISCIDPKDLGDDPEHLGPQPFGWLREESPSNWAKILEQEFYRDFNFIYLHGADKMPPAIRINGYFGDGRGRAIFFHAIGQKMPVADFVHKPIKYFYHATYKPALKHIKKHGLGAKIPEKRLAWSFSRANVVCLSRLKEVAESYAETAEEIPNEWLDQIVVLKIPRNLLNLKKLRIDPNVHVELPEEISWEYQGVIPWSPEIKVLKSNPLDLSLREIERKVESDPSDSATILQYYQHLVRTGSLDRLLSLSHSLRQDIY